MDREMLESLLRRALLEPETARIDPQALAAISQVAQRHRGEALSYEPVAVELVDALLGVLYRGTGASGEEWNAMVRSVAGSLCEDEAAYNRLESLWHRLSEG